MLRDLECNLFSALSQSQKGLVRKCMERDKRELLGKTNETAPKPQLLGLAFN